MVRHQRRRTCGSAAASHQSSQPPRTRGAFHCRIRITVEDGLQGEGDWNGPGPNNSTNIDCRWHGVGPEAPPIGQVLGIKGELATMQVVSDVQKTVAVAKLLKTTNKVLKHEVAGVLGLSGPNTFCRTLQKNKGLDGKYPALGKVIAGTS